MRIISRLAAAHLFSENLSTLAYTIWRDGFGEERGATNLMSTSPMREIERLLIDEIKQTHDHGVAGALFFLKTALIDMRELSYGPQVFGTSLYDHENPTDALHGLSYEVEDDLYVAASAISTHNMRSYTYKGYTSCFSDRPITALLCFSDELQEWDRLTKSKPFSTCVLNEVEITGPPQNKELTIVFSPNSLSTKMIKNLFDLFGYNLTDENRAFFDAITIKG